MRQSIPFDWYDPYISQCSLLADKSEYMIMWFLSRTWDSDFCSVKSMNNSSFSHQSASWSSSYDGLLTHWGWVMHICVSKITIIGSDNGLSPGRHQTIIWTNARIFLIGLLGTNFNKILIEIDAFSFKKILLKMLSAKWQPFCLSLIVLMHWGCDKMAVILHITFSDWISCMKIVVFWSKFYRKLFSVGQITVIQHWSR